MNPRRRSWHPTSERTRRMVAEAELRKAREDEATREKLSEQRQRGESDGGVDFMYAAPPGLRNTTSADQGVAKRPVTQGYNAYEQSTDKRSVATAAVAERERLVLKSALTNAKPGCAPAHGKHNEGYELVEDEEEHDAEAAFLESLSTKEKRALLKRLESDDKAQMKSKRKKKRRRTSDSND